MVGTDNTDRIPMEQRAQIIQVPASEADIRGRVIQLIETVIVNLQFVRDPPGGFRHNLHQPARTDSRFSRWPEGAFIADDRSNQGRREIVLTGYAQDFIPVFQRILQVDSLLLTAVKIRPAGEPGPHQDKGRKGKDKHAGHRDHGNAKPARRLPGSLSGRRLSA